MPVGAGTPRYEERGLWLGTANWHGGFCHAPNPTPAGDKPPRYIFSFRSRPSVYNSARFAGGEPASRLIGGTSRIGVRDMLSYQSLMPAAACTPPNENWMHCWWKGQVSSVPRTPPLAGDKPQRYISLAIAIL